MAAKLQGITLQIGGDTSQLNDALKSTNKEINSTQNELKQVDKLLKLDPSNTELLAQKQQLLGKEISATSDKLEKLKTAKKQADDSGLRGTEEGEKAYRELQREIIETENKLKSFKNEQDEVGNKFDLLGTKASSMNKAMAAAGAGVLALGAGLVKAGIDSAAYADDINTLATQTGLTTEQIQKFQYASDIIDVSLDTLTGSMAKLTRNMATASKGTGDAAKAFNTLGVSITDSNGELRNNQEVFNATIKALGEMENETQRDALAMQIFGKSAQDLNPLIKGGADTLEELGNKAEELGLIMSQDALDAANELNDGIDELKAQWSAATKSLGADVSQFLIPVIQAAQDLIKWMLDNKDTLVVALSAIAAGIAAFNMVTMIQNMVKAFQAWKIATEGMTIAQQALNLVMSLNPIGLVVAAIAALVAALVVAWQNSETFRNVVTGVFDKVKEVVTGFIDACVVFFTETLPQAFNTFLEFFKMILGWIVDYIKDPIGTIKKLLEALLPQALEWAKKMLGKIKEGFSKMAEVGKYIVEGIWNGIVNAKDWLLNKIKSFASSITDGIKSFFGIESPSKVMRDEVGKYLAQGIGVGFDKEMASVINDMTATASEVANAISTELDINAIPNINKSITSQNFYTTKSYNNSYETIKQPVSVDLKLEKTSLGKVLVPILEDRNRIIGVNLS